MKKIAIIGGGNMGEALLAGLLADGTAECGGVWTTDVDASRLAALRTKYAVKTGHDNREAASWADIMVIAVKPQMVAPILKELKDHVRADALIISVATGVSLGRMAAALGGNRKLVRVMTNTPVLVRAGASAMAFSPLVTEGDREFSLALFQAVGKVVVVEESMMDAVTGLSGSGPAYVFQMIEAMADGGVKMGLTRETALTLAAQTVLGAAQLLIETNEHPGRLKDKVASPGGTTIAGLHALEVGGVRAAFMSAIEAATKRAEELGKS